MFKPDNNKVVNSNSGKTNKMVMNLFRNLMRILNINAFAEFSYLTLNAKKTFNYLRQEFIKAPIL